MACCLCCVSEDGRIERVLSKFPSVLVSQAAPGLVQKLVGRVAVSSTGGMLSSPLSGRPCVYYEVTVEELVEHGDEKRWVDRVNEKQGVDFFLTDDTGAHDRRPTQGETVCVFPPTRN